MFKSSWKYYYAYITAATIHCSKQSQEFWSAHQVQEPQKQPWQWWQLQQPTTTARCNNHNATAGKTDVTMGNDNQPWQPITTARHNDHNHDTTVGNDNTNVTTNHNCKMQQLQQPQCNLNDNATWCNHKNQPQLQDTMTTTTMTQPWETTMQLWGTMTQLQQPTTTARCNNCNNHNATVGNNEAAGGKWWLNCGKWWPTATTNHNCKTQQLQPWHNCRKW